MGICRWYSIILIGILMLRSLCEMFYSDNGTVRLANFIAIILYIPMMIYLIMN